MKSSYKAIPPTTNEILTAFNESSEYTLTIKDAIDNLSEDQKSKFKADITNIQTSMTEAEKRELAKIIFDVYLKTPIGESPLETGTELFSGTYGKTFKDKKSILDEVKTVLNEVKNSQTTFSNKWTDTRLSNIDNVVTNEKLDEGVKLNTVYANSLVELINNTLRNTTDVSNIIPTIISEIKDMKIHELVKNELDTNSVKLNEIKNEVLLIKGIAESIDGKLTDTRLAIIDEIVTKAHFK